MGWVEDSHAERVNNSLEAFDESVRQNYPAIISTGILEVPEAHAEALTAWVSDPHPGVLLFTGPVGSGKTRLALTTVREVLASVEVAHPTPRWAFWRVASLLDAIKPESGFPGAFTNACTVDLLVLDELGVERKTEWTDERFHIIIDERWMKQKRTIVTTNLGGKDLRESVGDRIYSRLLHDATIVKLVESDYRR